jgi:hypothetical protein
MNSVKFFISGNYNSLSKLIRGSVACVIFFGLNLFCVSCDVINPDESIPVYFKIDNINLIVDPLSDGSASHKISDAWVYVDGDFVGTYELPCKFPVLKEGEHDIIVKAGIKMNGISASRGYYPFYKPYEQHVNLAPGETYNLSHSVTYFADKVQFNEEFEVAGISLEKFGDSDTTIELTSDASTVYEGAYSGIINLNSDYDHALVATSEAYDLPKNSTPVFLELNYKCNNPFKIGLYAIISGQSTKKEVITINKSDEWNKIYINLTYTCASEQNANNFKLYFEVYKDPAVENPFILLDNIKLVYNK